MWTESLRRPKTATYSRRDRVLAEGAVGRPVSPTLKDKQMNSRLSNKINRLTFIGHRLPAAGDVQPEDGTRNVITEQLQLIAGQGRPGDVQALKTSQMREHLLDATCGQSLAQHEIQGLHVRVLGDLQANGLVQLDMLQAQLFQVATTAKQLSQSFRRDARHTQVQVLQLAFGREQMPVDAKHFVVDAGLRESKDDNASGEDHGQDSVFQDFTAQVEASPQGFIVDESTEPPTDQGTSQERLFRQPLQHL